MKVPSRLAAPREKSGARDPISRVSVRFFIIGLTLSHVEIRNNNGWGSGAGETPALRLGAVLASPSI